MQLSLRQLFVLLLALAFLTAVFTAGDNLDRLGAAAVVGFCLSTLLAIWVLRTESSPAVRRLVIVIQGVLIAIAVLVIALFFTAWRKH